MRCSVCGMACNNGLDTAVGILSGIYHRRLRTYQNKDQYAHARVPTITDGCDASTGSHCVSCCVGVVAATLKISMLVSSCLVVGNMS